MPIFDYKCPCCGVKKDNVFVHKYDKVIKCTNCRATMKKLVPTGIAGVCFPSEGIFLEHVSPTGKTFHSKKEMHEYEVKNGMEIDCLH